MRGGREIPGDRDAEASLLRELESLYAEVDAAFAATSCPGTTECCRFGRTGREPYVTSLEAALVMRAVRRRGNTLPARPGPLHETHRELPVVRDERACPLLDPEGRCSIYGQRPFGCRTFYCERATSLSPVRHKAVVDFVRRLKDLAARHEPRGDEGRPLTRALETSKSGARTAGPSVGRRRR